MAQLKQAYYRRMEWEQRQQAAHIMQALNIALGGKSDTKRTPAARTGTNDPRRVSPGKFMKIAGLQSNF